MGETLTATLRVITPLFSEGAEERVPTEEDGTAGAPARRARERRRGGPLMRGEIRAETIKGLLRFWHRALHPEPACTPPADEGRIFGTTSAGSVMRLMVDDVPEFKRVGRVSWPGQVAYLGRGLIDGRKDGNWTVREWLDPEAGTEFTVRCRFGPHARTEDMRVVADALWALCMFGGIGGRSRRGFGSVQLVALDSPLGDGYVQEYATVDELLSVIPARLGAMVAPLSALPEHTAFSTRSRVLASPAWPNWRKGLGDAARAMLAWRGWRDAYDWTEPGTQLFEQDRGVVLGFLEAGPRPDELDDFPRRMVFGAPHNYYFPKYGNVRVDALRAGVTLEQAQEDGTGVLGRRASPLFLSAKQVGEQIVVLQTFLPARFLPEGARVRVAQLDDDGKPIDSAVAPFREGYAAIEHYLDWLTGRLGASPPRDGIQLDRLQPLHADLRRREVQLFPAETTPASSA